MQGASGVGSVEIVRCGFLPRLWFRTIVLETQTSGNAEIEDTLHLTSRTVFSSENDAQVGHIQWRNSAWQWDGLCQ